MFCTGFTQLFSLDNLLNTLLFIISVLLSLMVCISLEFPLSFPDHCKLAVLFTGGARVFLVNIYMDQIMILKSAASHFGLLDHAIKLGGHDIGIRV